MTGSAQTRSPRGVRIGIDGSSLHGGGGITHIASLLAAAHPIQQGVSEVVIWGSQRMLDQLPERSWLWKRTAKSLAGGYWGRLRWQRSILGRVAKEAGCDVLFVPGGSFTTGFRPIVTMSQNLLPFEWRELRRFGISLKALRLVVLRFLQTRSFKKADGLIFLSQYAYHVVGRAIGSTGAATTIIPHGVDERFRRRPAKIGPALTRSRQEQTKILYVSRIEPYKHQLNVALAVDSLRKDGKLVSINFVGGSGFGSSMFHEQRLNIDPDELFIKFSGEVEYGNMHLLYHDCDIFIFASSCENMPNILVEAMASGLPIACSSKGPMPEILKDGGEYFDPESVTDIADTIDRYLVAPDNQVGRARRAFELANEYDWQRCADETFRFLVECAQPAKTKV